MSRRTNPPQQRRKVQKEEKDMKRDSKRPSVTNITLDASTLEMLSQVQNKVVNAAALNGGFDRLIAKVEGIEAGQTQIVDRVDSIHNAIFDQNDGLFSLMHQSRLSRAQEKAEIDVQLAGIETWKDQQQKSTEEEKKDSEQLSLIVRKQQADLEDLVMWKSSVSSSFKWVITALGGSIVTVLGKFLHDWIFTHWK